MSWVKMTMKFPGKCTVCGKTVDRPGWILGARYECSQVADECMACGTAVYDIFPEFTLERRDPVKLHQDTCKKVRLAAIALFDV